MLIRTGDTVEVIAGADRGQKSRVILVDRATGKALVEGVNRVYKHVRRSQKNPQGGRLSKEMPVQLSNLKYFCDSCGLGVRLGARFLDDGSKERYCRKCGTGVGQIAPPKRGARQEQDQSQSSSEELNGEPSHGHNSTSARAVRKRDFAATGSEARPHESALAAEA
jgi:large subunit ribosomal protein L24